MIDYGFGVYFDAIDPDSGPQLRHWRNDFRVRSWCRQVGLISQLDQDAWMRRQNDDPTIRMFAIFDPYKSQIGVCGLTSIDLINSRAEFSLYIAPEKQGLGYGLMALKTLVKFGFDELGLNSIWGETFDGNPGAKMFEKVGFKFEGTRRDFYYKKGKFINAHLYSILRSEFRC